MSKPPHAPLPTHWPYRADAPQRYFNNYDLYQSRGGTVRLQEDVSGFVAGGVNEGDISRFYFFCLACDQLLKEEVIGDFAELGAYKGNTATLLARMARRMGTTAWILDTFEGFDAADFKGLDSALQVHFSDTSLESVRALVGEDNTKYVKGHFPGSTSQMPDDLRFALVHIDCDLHNPIFEALRYFYPRVLPGGYIIIHDYASLAWAGAERAVDEFFADKPEAVIPLPDSAGSAVVRKTRTAGISNNWRIQKGRRLLSAGWAEAGHGRLTELLGQGWSVPEPWGVWGVGEAHYLSIYLQGEPRDEITVRFRVSAALLGPRLVQQVDVRVKGEILASWDFIPECNKGVRTLVIPLQMISTDRGVPTVELEFRPHSVMPVSQLDPGNKDDRVLGLALEAIRLEA